MLWPVLRDAHDDARLARGEQRRIGDGLPLPRRLDATRERLVRVAARHPRVAVGERVRDGAVTGLDPGDSHHTTAVIPPST
ncbi:hypothetical protein ACFPRL_18635 [Pseudoclavibacter helvolus]